jgi:hypothetical protein
LLNDGITEEAAPRATMRTVSFGTVANEDLFLIDGPKYAKKAEDSAWQCWQNVTIGSILVRDVHWPL